MDDNAFISGGDELTQASSPLSITVLAGGPSRERAVSQTSGQSVTEALEAGGFNVTLADITPDDLSALDTFADVIFPVLHGQFGEDGQLQRILEARHLSYCGSVVLHPRLNSPGNRLPTRVG